jgi:GDP-L-fucose synthase
LEPSILYETACSATDFHLDTRAFFRNRRVAVAGGTGFIGSHVVEQLLCLGARPIVLSRRPESSAFLKNCLHRIELRRCDLESYESTREALKEASVVLSLAAKVAGLEYNSTHAASIFHENMQIFLNVIKAVQELKTDRFLVTSSACVYPRFCSIPTPEEEGSAGEPEPTNSGYGWAKRMQEYLGAQYAREFGLSVAIARPYNAYGPRDNFDLASSHVIPALIRKAFESTDGFLDVWGDGSHSRSFLYVDDFARGLLEVAARYPMAEPLNLGAEEETTIRDLAARIAGLVSEIRGMSIHPRFEPAALTGQPRRCCDASKATRTLGFRAQVALSQGLKRTVEWFAKNESRTLLAHL